MRANRKITFLLIVPLLIFLLSGCLAPRWPADVVLHPSHTEGQSRHAGMSKRFPESVVQGPTAVESAIELSEKYAKLSEEAAALRGENQSFAAENHHLQGQLAAREAQLQQTQKELAEANDLLIEMRIELNNWKANILGFRGEMRDAEKAQLEALLKILNILGGEVKAESAQGEKAGSTVASSDRPGRLRPQETPDLGERNE